MAGFSHPLPIDPVLPALVGAVGLGGTYTFDNGVALTAGASDFWLGDTDVSETGVKSRFANNTAVGLSVNIGYTF